MAWLSGALQNARARSDTWKERVQQGAAVVRARAQQFEEVLANNLQAPQASYTAQEVLSQLEHDARELVSTAAATEIVQRWVVLLRQSPQPRYPKSVSEPGCPVEEFTFQQVFLKSNALEYALDAVTRSAELRSHLRTHALRSPEAWPEEKTPAVDFAFAFTHLLRNTIGPPEVWLDFLAVLLSSDKGPADEPCHAWLLQLLSGLRGHWEGANASDREHEIEALESASRQGLQVASQNVVKATAGNITHCLASLAERRVAVRQAYRAWNLRCALIDDIGKAAFKHKEIAQIRAESAETVKYAAAERVVVLDAEAKRIHTSTEQIKQNLGEQVSEVKSKLAPYENARQQLERELEEVELTQQELMKQIGQLSERREGLRKKLQDGLKEEEVLRGDLEKVDQLFKERLGREEKNSNRIDSARALADAVVNLATGLASPETETQDPQRRRRLSSATLNEDASTCQARAALAALELGEHEVTRLGYLAQVVDVCCTVAEERESSREAMAKLGVSVATLEADVVGEAEIEQALHDALVEIDRGLEGADNLVCNLTELAKEDGLALEAANKRRAAALAEMLSGGISQVRSCREKLMTFAPLEVTPEDCGEESTTAITEEPTDGTLDSFLESAPVDNVKNSVANVGAAASRLFSRLGVGKAPSPSANSSPNPSVEVDDPFLLDGGVQVISTANVLPTGNLAKSSASTATGNPELQQSGHPRPAVSDSPSVVNTEGARKDSSLEVFRMDDDDDEDQTGSGRRKSTSDSLDPFESSSRGDLAADLPSLPTPPAPPPPEE